MSLLKYRTDIAESQGDGSRVWRSVWMGGHTLAKIQNCRVESLQGEPRVTAYVQGEADTYFSQPAKAHYRGIVMTGYITLDDCGNLVFRHTYY